MGVLNATNIRKEYPHLSKLLYEFKLYKKPLLQKNYGEKNDCTLTCMAFMLGDENYVTVEDVAKRYCYDGDRWGTIAITVKPILQKVLDEIGINGRSKSAYFKGIGWNYEKVKKLIDERHFVILNMMNDGRGYYKNHSVTIIGYRQHQNERFLVVFDNWDENMNYVDYDKLSKVSSINWYENVEE